MAKVLIVDDYESFRFSIKEFLRMDEHESITAEDGADAWSLLEGGERVDIVISDNNMLRMDGIELLRLVRGNDRYVGMRFVLMSGHEVLKDGTKLTDLCAELDATFVHKGRIVQEIRDIVCRLLSAT